MRTHCGDHWRQYGTKDLTMRPLPQIDNFVLLIFALCSWGGRGTHNHLLYKQFHPYIPHRNI